jgi:hypothetical protein
VSAGVQQGQSEKEGKRGRQLVKAVESGSRMVVDSRLMILAMDSDQINSDFALEDAQRNLCSSDSLDNSDGF